MPGDRARITRALEVVEATGRSLTDWHREAHDAGARPGRRREGVSRARPRRTLSRASTRASIGCSAPVRSPRSRRWHAAGSRPSLPAMKALGVPWLIRHLEGEITLAEAAEAGKRDSRRYSKRQDDLVPQSTAGLDLGGARHRGGGNRARARRADARASTATSRARRSSSPAASTHQAGRISMSTSKCASRTRQASTPLVAM